MRKRVKGVIQDRPKRVWTSDKPKHNTPGPSIVSKDELVFESDVRFEGDVVGMPSIVENRWHLSNSNVTEGRRLVAKLGETGGNGTYDAVALSGTLIDHNSNFGNAVPDVIPFTVYYTSNPSNYPGIDYSPTFNITMDGKPSNCELELWENDLNTSTPSREVYLILNVTSIHKAYTITWNQIDGELSAVGVPSPESSTELWAPIENVQWANGFTKATGIIGYRDTKHLEKTIEGFNEDGWGFVCQVSSGLSNALGSTIKAVFSGSRADYVTLTEAEIYVGHHEEILVKSTSLYYNTDNRLQLTKVYSDKFHPGTNQNFDSTLAFKIVSDTNDKFDLYAKPIYNTSASGDVALNVEITSHLGAAVLFDVYESNRVGYGDTDSTNLLSPHLPFPVGTGDEPNFWGINGAANENIRRYDYFPHGKHDVVWIARNMDSTNNSDGGFNSQQFAIDHTKQYRFSIWAKQTEMTQTTIDDGSVYLGFHGYNSATSNSNLVNKCNDAGTITTTNDGNPYFKGGGDLVRKNEWVLIVGYVDGSGMTNSNPGGYGGSGRFDTSGRKETTAQGGKSNYFRWIAGATHANIRAYQYYNESADHDDVIFWGPRVDEVGTGEPTVEQLIEEGGYSDTTGMWGGNVNHTHTHVCKHGETWSGRNGKIHDYIPANVATPRVLQNAIGNTISMTGAGSMVRYAIPGLYLNFVPRKGAKYLVTIMITHSHSHVISFGCNLAFPRHYIMTTGFDADDPEAEFDTTHYGFPINKDGFPVKPSGTNSNSTDRASAGHITGTSIVYIQCIRSCAPMSHRSRLN